MDDNFDYFTYSGLLILFIKGLLVHFDVFLFERYLKCICAATCYANNCMNGHEAGSHRTAALYAFSTSTSWALCYLSLHCVTCRCIVLLVD